MSEENDIVELLQHITRRVGEGYYTDSSGEVNWEEIIADLNDAFDDL